MCCKFKTGRLRLNSITVKPHLAVLQLSCSRFIRDHTNWLVRDFIWISRVDWWMNEFSLQWNWICYWFPDSYVEDKLSFSCLVRWHTLPIAHLSICSHFQPCPLLSWTQHMVFARAVPTVTSSLNSSPNCLESIAVIGPNASNEDVQVSWVMTTACM